MQDYYLQYRTKFTDHDRNELDAALEVLERHLAIYEEIVDNGMQIGDVLDPRYIITLAIHSDCLKNAKDFVSNVLKDLVKAFGLEYEREVDEETFCGRYLVDVENILHNAYKGLLETSTSLTFDFDYKELARVEEQIETKRNEVSSSKEILAKLCAEHVDLDRSQYPYLKGALAGVTRLTPSQARELARVFNVSPVILID